VAFELCLFQFKNIRLKPGLAGPLGSEVALFVTRSALQIFDVRMSALRQIPLLARLGLGDGPGVRQVVDLLHREVEQLGELRGVAGVTRHGGVEAVGRWR